MIDKIKWCSGKKGGLSLVEPNSNLAEAYTKKAEEALESIFGKPQDIEFLFNSDKFYCLQSRDITTL